MCNWLGSTGALGGTRFVKDDLAEDPEAEAAGHLLEAWALVEAVGPKRLHLFTDYCAATSPAACVAQLRDRSVRGLRQPAHVVQVPTPLLRLPAPEHAKYSFTSLKVYLRCAQLASASRVLGNLGDDILSKIGLGRWALHG